MLEVTARKVQLEQELKAYDVLDSIEERREKSLTTNINRVHEKYDLLREVALQSIPNTVKDALDNEAHRNYLNRVQAREDAKVTPVDEADIEDIK